MGTEKKQTFCLLLRRVQRNFPEVRRSALHLEGWTGERHQGQWRNTWLLETMALSKNYTNCPNIKHGISHSSFPRCRYLDKMTLDVSFDSMILWFYHLLQYQKTCEVYKTVSTVLHRYSKKQGDILNLSGMKGTTCMILVWNGNNINM